MYYIYFCKTCKDVKAVVTDRDDYQHGECSCEDSYIHYTTLTDEIYEIYKKLFKEIDE